MHKMTQKEHCDRCRILLGEEFPHVHLWLDEFFGTPEYRTRHRKVRHHKVGIEEVRKKWGDRAAKAAKLHILDDLRTSEDRNADEYSIPLDKEDFIRRGYW